MSPTPMYISLAILYRKYTGVEITLRSMVNRAAAQPGGERGGVDAPDTAEAEVVA
jgi:hypothetical protein